MGKTKLLFMLLIIVIFAGIGAFIVFSANQPSEDNNDESISDEGEEQDNHYDVIVLSGEPEGVSAAVSAARNGASVLLIEHRDGLGGLITYGMLNYLDIPQNNQQVTVSQGIFAEWQSLVGGSGVATVDLEEAEQAFLELIQGEENITLSLNSDMTDVQMEGKKVTGITVESEGNQVTATADRFIDASPDGDLAVMAGAPYFMGQQDIGKEDKMAATLMIYLDRVDWDQVKEAAQAGILGGAGINETAAWGFPEVLHVYDEIVENETTNMRGLNIGRTLNGEVFINALQIFDVDGLDEESKEKAIEEGIREIDHFVPWLQENLSGFEEARIVDFPTELYVRETRHIESEYMLPVHALWENEHHWDDIAIGGYPADIQATAPTNFGTITVNPDQYGIPFRSLIPLDVENLLVASKASGFSSLAAGSARIIPTGMATAEAAGAASALSIHEKIDFRSLSENEEFITQLQDTLREQGAYLDQLDDPDYSYKGLDFYPALRHLLSYDIISGGYNNDFRLDEEMTADYYVKSVRRGLMRMYPDAFEEVEDRLDELEEELEEEPMLDEHIQKIFEAAGWEQPPRLEMSWTRKEAFILLEDRLWEMKDVN